VREQVRAALASGPKRVRDVSELLGRERKLVAYHLVTLQLRGLAELDGHLWSLTARGAEGLPATDAVDEFVAMCREFETVAAVEVDPSPWDPEPILSERTPESAPPPPPEPLPARRLPVAAQSERQSAPLGAIAGRPVTRGDCIDGERPCPYVSCRYHLYLDVTKSGAVKLTFPNLEPDQMSESCALDVIDREGAVILARVGHCFGVTRERVRQIETRAYRKLKRGLAEYRDFEGDNHMSALAAAMEER
jgi:hypothetical protein